MTRERRIEEYQERYSSDYIFEAKLVKYRHQMLLEKLERFSPRVVVEAGCGLELLYDEYAHKARNLDKWIIVEPSQIFYEAASQRKAWNLEVVNSFFEQAVESLQGRLGNEPDLVLLSGLLHEVSFPGKLLHAAHAIMGKKSLLHVNVPNANSLHRQLAVAMGLIPKVGTLSDRNIKLFQERIYTLDSLVKELVGSGFVPVEIGGYFLKPFTHAQMEVVSSQLGNEILDGFYHLGKTLPDLASEIYVEARMA